MPPKAAHKQKVKAEAEPTTPTPQSKAKRKAASPSPGGTTPASKKKIKKEAPPSLSLEQDSRAAVPIDVTVEGGLVAEGVKDGKFGLTLKLEGLSAFTMLKTLVFTSGEFEGHQAILVKPAKAFRFMALPDEVRGRVYKIYFAANGIIGKEIVLEGRRADKDIYAKSYAEGSQNRVALLATNKTIYEEAAPVLYENALKLESTTALVDFMAQSKDTLKTKLKNVEIKTYVKTQSRIALQLLSTAVNITRLHFDSGVFTDGDPAKAAKVFFQDAGKFLEAVSGKMGAKGAGVDVLSFGKQALTAKEGKTTQPWSEDMKETFLEELRAKMK